MKKIAVISFIAALGLAAGSAVLAQGERKITLVGGSVGGAWSAIGNAIGETIRREAPGSSFGYEPGREAANIQLVSQGKVELGIAHAQLVKRAQSGEEPFRAPIKNVRAVALIDPQAAVQILVRKDSGIESFEQIRQSKKPVRVALNQRGTLMAVTGEEVFKAYGITPKDIESWGGRIHNVDYNAGLDMMKNGQVDVIINMLAFPSGQVVSATREMDVKMLAISPEVAGKLGEHLGTAPITVPAGTYAFQPQAIPTVTGNVVLVASSEMKDDEVAAIVKGMLKHFDYLKQAHATLGRLEPASLTKVAPLELHPGAEKAYREAGLLK
ncbi:TAXI family TRAP transporter solute-binding subunit [Microvirga massiliensis]|uniref:TAXI family TRAP transporter solute-binding subunit n=1 Tax=Microvirga massiliensis TaxID=1033741 RepID=UPI00062B46AF|nr:TAXI family TRAP transporter solute-binding subunit [Microvirga massiliensis]